MTATNRDDRFVLDAVGCAALRAARRAQRRTQAQVADLIGVSVWRYGRFERGVDGLPHAAWDRLRALLPIAPHDIARTPPPVGAMVRAARRANRISMSAIAARLPYWTPKRVRRLENGDDPWPVDACAALARMVGLDPETIGLGAPVAMTEATTALMWSAYYDRPSDLRVVADRLRPIVASLRGRDAGAWAAQAVGVALCDARRTAEGWTTLLHAAAGIDPLDGAIALNAYVAVHMRLARTALEMAREQPERRMEWLAAARRHAARAMQRAAHARPRLHVVATLTAAEVDAALGRIDDAAASMRAARALAASCAGRDDLTGVAVHDAGVLHASLACLLHAPDGMTGDLRRSMTNALRDLTSFAHDVQTPLRWRVDMQGAMAHAWARLGRPDLALHACTQAAALLPRCSSPKIIRRIHDALHLLPDTPDRTMALREIRAATREESR